MLVMKFLVALCAITATQSIIIHPLIEELITKTMSKLNSLDSATHDVALVHNVTNKTYINFMRDVYDTVMHSIPPQNAVIRAEIIQTMKNEKLRRVDIIIMVIDELNSVS
jgi:hypothetical protein